MDKRRAIELLAPAKDAEIAIQAILHGADAVYMGASSHGARHAAANTIDDIRRVADFAHIYRAKLYVTVNTIVYDSELHKVELLIKDLYEAGADAIIVQDMGVLRLDIPPIELHASTQCHIDSVEKALFLEDVGFSQLVLARELTLQEIENIASAVKVPVECFVHGALCVSYSGRCHASYACNGRSANRGECAQLCRLPYTLRDASGKTLALNRHLLSLKDFNASDRIGAMLDAGVCSFKIEGRLKDIGYVKNVTAAYRRILDKEIALRSEVLKRSSVGISEINFTPQLTKSFNRGFTHYFFDGQRPKPISSPLTNKSLGEPVESVSQLNNGDGISWFDKSGEYTGMQVDNTADPSLKRLFKSTQVFRTKDVAFDKQLAKPTAVRRVAVDMMIDKGGVTASDERGAMARVPIVISVDKALKPLQPQNILGKLGNTVFRLRDFTNNLPSDTFIAASQLSDAKRRLLEALEISASATRPIRLLRKENADAQYPSKTLDYKDNVANNLSERFYREHGVEEIERAVETAPRSEMKHGDVLMTCRHCILRDMGRCLKENNGERLKLPLTIESGTNRFALKFDCNACRMYVVKE